jgi:hypothetical protein
MVWTGKSVKGDYKAVVTRSAQRPVFAFKICGAAACFSHYENSYRHLRSSESPVRIGTPKKFIGQSSA